MNVSVYFVCRQAQSSLGCLTRYGKKCLPLEERSKFNDLIAGPQKVTLGLCTDETDLKSSKYLSLYKYLVISIYKLK